MTIQNVSNRSWTIMSFSTRETGLEPLQRDTFLKVIKEGASEDLIASNKWPIAQYLNILKTNKDNVAEDPYKFAKKMVSRSYQETSSAIDLEKMDLLIERTKDLGSEILKIEDADNLSEIRKTVQETQHFYRYGPDNNSGPVDLFHFAELITENPKLASAAPGLVHAARALLESQDEIVIAEKHAVRAVGESNNGWYFHDNDAKGLSTFLSEKGWLPSELLYADPLILIEKTNWKAVNDHIARRDSKLSQKIME
ncbi:MAG: hypothetical protein HYU64_14265 [Armatimonadetes bacterium]|nr:hypothetical protein [Armatimonadota bacterium]